MLNTKPSRQVVASENSTHQSHLDQTAIPDSMWAALQKEVEAELLDEPLLASLFHKLVLDHRCFEDALAVVLADKVQSAILPFETIHKIIQQTLGQNLEVVDSAQKDLFAFCDRDPACDRFSLPFLYYKGYQGLQLHRIAHRLWQNGRKELARCIQSQVSMSMAMDIHPAATIGSGILIDHATSIVIGETAVVGDNVSMLHEVTLGGTGKEVGDRHPKVGSGVLIGAGAKILGNVTIGDNAKIGAGSVVLEDVSPHCTVVGIPAKNVGHCPEGQPALFMDHTV